MSDLPIISFETESAWEQWLEQNHTTSSGIWMKIAKKGSVNITVLYPEALTVALCFGWIDGQKDRLDEDFWLQKFTPRRAKSAWSRINREKAIALIAQGRMREAGLQEIERAKADGRWETAYEPQSTISVPDDLQAALDQNPIAQAFFNQLNSANRYAILYRIATTKRPETRQRRIDEFIAMLNKQQKFR